MVWCSNRAPPSRLREVMAYYPVIALSIVGPFALVSLVALTLFLRPFPDVQAEGSGVGGGLVGGMGSARA